LTDATYTVSSEFQIDLRAALLCLESENFRGIQKVRRS